MPTMTLDDIRPTDLNLTKKKLTISTPQPLQPKELASTQTKRRKGTPRQEGFKLGRKLSKLSINNRHNLKVDCSVVALQPESFEYSPTLPTFSTELAANQFPPSPAGSLTRELEDDDPHAMSSITRIVHESTASSSKLTTFNPSDDFTPFSRL